jgi:mono/diheme cytochrome c family protein
VNRCARWFWLIFIVEEVFMSITAIAGLLFVVIGLSAMFLMMHLWGYPFDKVKRKSEAPPWAMLLHRLLGYVFIIIYIFMMWHMVPRLWEYQIEFPARTAIHIVVAFMLGFVLLIKVAIMRFFRHFEEWMPFLGISIMLLTVILTGLSLPVVFHERALAGRAPGGDAMSVESQARVAKLLPNAGLPDGSNLASLATEDALRKGRAVLFDNCVRCHDLKTILAKPRTPKGWWDTVSRMSEKPALFEPATELESMQVTAYLIAITPQLQKSVKRQREVSSERAIALTETDSNSTISSTISNVPSPDVPKPTTTKTVVASDDAGKVAVDLVKAKAVFMDVCSQCHPIADIDAAPPHSESDARAMVRRMVAEQDAELTAPQMRFATAWLIEHYVKKPGK